jgi:hypothetical protein
MERTLEAEPPTPLSPAEAAEIEMSQPEISIPIEEISRRAYELFLERGGGHGADIDDWLRAERELGGRVES